MNGFINSKLHLLPVILWASLGCLAAQSSKPQQRPFLSVDLRRFGFHPVSETDFKRGDAELFAIKNYDKRMRTIESWDDHTKVVFLSDDVLAVYFTREQSLQALFLDSKNGTLLKKQEWRGRVRHSGFDELDSEGRIYPLKDGKFVVCASDRLTLYSADFKILRELEILPKNSSDRWSIQVLPGGDQIFLRREPAGKVEYSWLDSDSLRVTHTEPGIRSVNFDPRGGVLASSHFLFADKIYSANNTSQTEPYPIESCPTNAVALDQDQLLRYGNCGFDVTKGTAKLWGRTSSNRERVARGFAGRNLAGNRFVLDYSGDGRSLLDGVRLSEDGTFLVYDVPNRKLVFSVDNDMPSWDGAAALSADGRKLAIFSGTELKIYSIP